MSSTTLSPLYLSITLPIHLSIYLLSVHLSINHSIYHSIYHRYLSIYLSISLSIYLSVYSTLSVYLSIYPSVYLFIYLSVILSIYLYMMIPLFLSIYLSMIPLYLSIYLSLYLLLYYSIYPFPSHSPTWPGGTQTAPNEQTRAHAAHYSRFAFLWKDNRLFPCWSRGTIWWHTFSSRDQGGCYVCCVWGGGEKVHGAKERQGSLQFAVLQGGRVIVWSRVYLILCQFAVCTWGI